MPQFSKAILSLCISRLCKQRDLTRLPFEHTEDKNMLWFAQLLGRSAVLNHVCFVLAASEHRQLCLKSWQVHNKFLHTWSCLVDFLSTPSQGRPDSSSAAQQCGKKEWAPPPPHDSSIPPPHTNHSPQISKKPQSGILAVLSPGLQPAQIKKMVSRCRPPSLPLHFKIRWLFHSLIFRWTIGGTGG